MATLSCFVEALLRAALATSMSAQGNDPAAASKKNEKYQRHWLYVLSLASSICVFENISVKIQGGHLSIKRFYRQ